MRGAGIMVIWYSTLQGLRQAEGKPLPKGSHIHTYTTAPRLCGSKQTHPPTFPEAEWLVLKASQGWLVAKEEVALKWAEGKDLCLRGCGRAICLNTELQYKAGTWELQQAELGELNTQFQSCETKLTPDHYRRRELEQGPVQIELAKLGSSAKTIN